MAKVSAYARISLRRDAHSFLKSRSSLLIAMMAPAKVTETVQQTIANMADLD
jgi:hypothetical protein